MDLLSLIKVTCVMVCITYLLGDMFLVSLLMRTRRQARREKRELKRKKKERAAVLEDVLDDDE